MVEAYYQADGITVYCADCRDVLPELGRFDLLLTDPPYGKKYARGRHGIGGGARFDLNDVRWDDAPSAGTIKQCITSANKAIVWGGNHLIDALTPTNCFLVWDKQNGNNVYADGEIAWTNMTITTRIFRKQWIGGSITESLLHPTQKPLPLMQWCLTHVPDAKTVLDPFAGSLTTAVACKLAGIQCVAIEREERYCEAGVKRLAQGVFDFEEAI